MLFGKDNDELKQKIDEVGKKLDEVLNDVKESQQKQEHQFEEAVQQLGLFSEEMKRAFEKITDELRAVETARSAVEKSTRSFVEVQQKIEQFIYRQLGDTIKENIGKLKLDVDKYSELRQVIEGMVLGLRSLGDEVEKLRVVTSTIKKSDFELSSYAKELAHTDQEKVRLMKEVDELQRLVARMRREPAQKQQKY